MRNSSIDGLRAIAMTMVMAQHCSLLPFGWVGVWLFFVISGFVITRGFLGEEIESTSRCIRFTAFMRRRAIRIIPVYIFYIVANIPFLIYARGWNSFGDIPYLLSFTYNWHMMFEFWPGSIGWAPFGHLWTLSVEQQFYLLFPLLMLLVAPAMQGRWAVGLVLLGPLLRFGASSWLSQHWSQEPGTLAFSIYAASLLHFDAFLIGSLLARWEKQPINHARLSKYLLPAALMVAITYAITYVAINWSNRARGTEALRNVYSGILYGQHREVFVYLAVNLLAATAVWKAINGSAGTRWLQNKALAWVGQVSYGGYLFHLLVLWLIGSAWVGSIKELPVAQRIGVLALAWLVTVALASASFVWFERPLASRLRPKTHAKSTDSISTKPVSR